MLTPGGRRGRAAWRPAEAMIRLLLSEMLPGDLGGRPAPSTALAGLCQQVPAVRLPRLALDEPSARSVGALA